MIKKLIKNTFPHIVYWYLRECIGSMGQKKISVEIFKYFPDYIKSNMDYTKSPLVMGVPWITFEAIDFLKRIIRPDMKVFEFGSGGSTRFFSERVAEVQSVEHDELWFKMVKDKIGRNKNLNIMLREGVEVQNTSIAPVLNEMEDPLDYRNYSTPILDFEDQYFDIILVDGKARNVCIANSLAKLKKGGYLIVDNSNRKSYFKSLDKLDIWLVLRSFGPSVNSKRFTQTSFFKKT